MDTAIDIEKNNTELIKFKINILKFLKEHNWKFFRGLFIAYSHNNNDIKTLIINLIVKFSVYNNTLILKTLINENLITDDDTDYKPLFMFAFDNGNYYVGSIIVDLIINTKSAKDIDYEFLKCFKHRLINPQSYCYKLKYPNTYFQYKTLLKILCENMHINLSDI